MTIGTMIREKRHPQGRLGEDEVAWVKGKLARWTTLVPDVDRLTIEEERALFKLVKEASANAVSGGDRFDVGQLPARSRKKLEALVEKAADKPGAFQTGRENADLQSKIGELARQALALPPRVRLEEAGSVRLPKLLVWDWLCRPDPVLYAEHLALTVLIVSMFENGAGLTRACTIERDADGDPVLLFDAKFGPVGRLSDERFPNWRDLLLHLGVNGVFVVDGSHPIWRVKIGPRLKAQRRSK